MNPKLTLPKETLHRLATNLPVAGAAKLGGQANTPTGNHDRIWIPSLATTLTTLWD